jgi:hypothetical protein
LIQAVLEGKSLGYEYTEDILTSTVFGTLKYLRPDMILIPFIESAFLYNGKRTTLWEKLNSEGIELRCYQEVEYVFWTWNQNYGEPDLILIFRDHVHGFDDLLLIVEAKFKSGKSGTDENDQLVRYFEAINNDIENFTESSVSSFKGRKGYIVYLTEAEAYSDITATTKIIQSRYIEIKENVFHLRWHARQEELKLMHRLVKPKYFMPVHGEFRHLKLHSNLAQSLGMSEQDIFLMENGQVLELSRKKAQITGSVQSGSILIDGLGIGDVGNIVLRDRKHLSEDGLIVVVAVLNSKGKVVCEPDVISRGFVYVKEAETLMDEMRVIAKESIEKGMNKKKNSYNAIKNSIKDELGSYVYQKTKRKPMILPVIIEIPS